MSSCSASAVSDGVRRVVRDKETMDSGSRLGAHARGVENGTLRPREVQLLTPEKEVRQR